MTAPFHDSGHGGFSDPPMTTEEAMARMRLSDRGQYLGPTGDPQPAVDIPCDEGPRLGLATTEELLRELICRFKIDAVNPAIGRLLMLEHALVLAEMLGSLDAPTREYRTVGG